MDCVFFDLDGTLADTEVLKAEALSEAVRELGGYSPPEIYKNVMGKSWEVVTQTFFDHAGIMATTDDLNPLFRKHYSSFIDDRLVDSRNAAKVISWFRRKNVKVGLVSSASPWMIEKVLRKIQLSSAFDLIISGTDTKKHKPDPEAYILALAKLSVNAKDTIAFEDSESGFHAATAAGVDVIGIRHSFNTHHSFSLCNEVIDSFDDYTRKK